MDHPYLRRFDRHKEILEKLTAHGDTLVREMVVPEDEIRVFYRDYINSLRKGAHRSAKDNPDHASILWEYVKAQEEMCDIMERDVVSCVWLLQKH